MLFKVKVQWKNHKGVPAGECVKLDFKISQNLTTAEAWCEDYPTDASHTIKTVAEPKERIHFLGERLGSVWYFKGTNKPDSFHVDVNFETITYTDTHMQVKNVWGTPDNILEGVIKKPDESDGLDAYFEVLDAEEIHV